MKVLAIDTSSIVATVALLEDDKLLCEYILNHTKTHSQKLMPMVEEVLEATDNSMKDIDYIAIASGPGSFTGLRIGGATAKGLAFAIDKKVVSISTLEGLAFNLPYCEGLICPIMDARRDQVYTGIYKWEMGNFYALKEDDALALEELLDYFKSGEDVVTFLGDGIGVHRDKILEVLGPKARFAPVNASLNRASSIGQLAMYRINKGEAICHHDFAPSYLRKSQAEREYDNKHRGCQDE